ncbi:hypothetical protein [Oerskovia jenensis]|uniref:hypothetical protein n=1 Tax=Oerskovia jenensis TaxID=162169 RepID=UPI0036DE1FB6
MRGVVAAAVALALVTSGQVAMAAVESDPGASGVEAPTPTPIETPLPASTETPTPTPGEKVAETPAPGATQTAPAVEETPDATPSAPASDQAGVASTAPVAPSTAPVPAPSAQRVMPTTRPVLTPVLGYDAVYVQHEERGGPGVQGMFRLAPPTEADIVAYETRLGESGPWTSHPVTEGEMLVPFTPETPGRHSLYTRWVSSSGQPGWLNEFSIPVAGGEPVVLEPPLAWSLPAQQPEASTIPIHVTTPGLVTKSGEIRVRLGEVELARVAVTRWLHPVELDRAALGSGNVAVTIEYVAVPGDTPWTTEAVVCGAGCTLSPGSIQVAGGKEVRGLLRVETVDLPVPTPTSWTYQWFVDGAPIEGAQDPSYSAAPWFAGKTITVAVTAHRPGYAEWATTSTGVVVEPVEDPSIVLQAKVQGGWAAETWVDGRGITSVGTTGKGRELRGLRAWNADLTGYGWTNALSFSAHVREQGWLAPVPGGRFDIGDPAGVQPLEALRVEFSGMNAKFYDVYYRVHVGGIGWLGWAKNGEVAGTVGYGSAIEAVEMTLVRKVGQEPPAGNGMPASFERGQDPNAQLRLQAHVENIGWQGEVSGGQQAGTTGQRLRVEALKFRLEGPVVPGGVRASAHVQDIGWQPFAKDGEVVGTTGRALQVEAFKIELTGQMAQRYDIYYRTHAQELGWLGWAKNGAPSGSAGYVYRLEAVEVRLVPKGLPGPDTPGVPAFKQR